MSRYFFRLVHTSDISISNENKGWIFLWDLRRQNNENFSLFRLLFCSLLMLGLWSYAYAYDDPYVAGLTWFLCFAFCFALMLMLSCEPGFSLLACMNIVGVYIDCYFLLYQEYKILKYFRFHRFLNPYFFALSQRGPVTCIRFLSWFLLFCLHL